MPVTVMMGGMLTLSRVVPAVSVLCLLLTTTAVAAQGSPTDPAPDRVATTAAEGHCAGRDRIAVPRAVEQKTACLADLTTASTVVTGHTDASDWTGLHAPGTRNPTGVPGIQVDGHFRDTSSSNVHHGWRSDAQFVMRFPDRWNGRVVVSGAPGTRTQYAGDFIFSDWLLARGYAYAMTDKGNSGSSFYRDGRRPGDAIGEWNRRVTQLTKATRAVAEQVYRREPRRTYLIGVSNGGYLVRWQLENKPWLYDGGVDWEGTLYRGAPPNLLTYLPVALRHYPAYLATGSEAAHRAMIRAGFQRGSEYTWDYHYAVYWDLTQRLYREELDPQWDGDQEAGTPFCQSGLPRCDADYDYSSRPTARRALDRVGLTGRIRKPMLTVHGTHDALLPIRTDSDVYARMVDRRASRSERGAGDLHRYYRIRGGTHVDGLRAEYGDRVRPLLPCARRAFVRMVAWVEDGRRPPRDATLGRMSDRDRELGRCPLS